MLETELIIRTDHCVSVLKGGLVQKSSYCFTSPPFWIINLKTLTHLSVTVKEEIIDTIIDEIVGFMEAIACSRNPVS